MGFGIGASVSSHQGSHSSLYSTTWPSAFSLKFARMRASPTPTIHGLGRPFSRGKRTSLVVDLTSLSSRQGGFAPCISEKCRGGSRTMVRALEKKMHASLLVYLRVQRFQASQQSFSSSPPHPKRSKRACCRFGAASPNRQQD